MRAGVGRAAASATPARSAWRAKGSSDADGPQDRSPAVRVAPAHGAERRHRGRGREGLPGVVHLLSQREDAPARQDARAGRLGTGRQGRREEVAARRTSAFTERCAPTPPAPRRAPPLTTRCTRPSPAVLPPRRTPDRASHTGGLFVKTGGLDAQGADQEPAGGGP